MSVFEMVEGVHFDCCGHTIKCRADRDGCEVFTVDVEMRQVNVLARDADEAIGAARYYVAQFLSAEIV